MIRAFKNKVQYTYGHASIVLGYAWKKPTKMCCPVRILFWCHNLQYLFSKAHFSTAVWSESIFPSLGSWFQWREIEMRRHTIIFWTVVCFQFYVSSMLKRKSAKPSVPVHQARSIQIWVFHFGEEFSCTDLILIKHLWDKMECWLEVAKLTKVCSRMKWHVITSHITGKFSCPHTFGHVERHPTTPHISHRDLHWIRLLKILKKTHIFL